MMFESRSSRMYCQMFSIGLSSGHCGGSGSKEIVSGRASLAVVAHRNRREAWSVPTSMAATRGRNSRSGYGAFAKPVEVEIVKRSDNAKGFDLLPKRWVVERTIAWLNRCRRLAKDWECLARKALAFLKWASFRLMLRKLCLTSK